MNGLTDEHDHDHDYDYGLPNIAMRSTGRLVGARNRQS
jgi:hypothetical protein